MTSARGVAPTTRHSEEIPAPDRWRMLVLLSLAELLGMAVWFGATAVSAELRARWLLEPAQVGWLTTIVQLGFVVGTAGAAVLNLADLVPMRYYFAIAVTSAAIANLALLVVPDYETALVSRFAVGLFLAGVYPPGMKMVATWFRERRGMAIGAVVGALTLGKATPYLVHAVEGARAEGVIVTTSAGALASALLVLVFYHDGPHPFERRPFSWRLVRSVVAQRDWRLATGGYLGHMWELYSFWTWIPVFLAASLTTAHGTADAAMVQLLVFLIIGVGGLGCVWGGRVADRIGHERFVIGALATSGLCCLLAALVYGQPLWVLLPLALLWGMSVVADSAQFSTLVTRAVPAHAVGTALTLQTSLGFLLTMLSIQLVPLMVRLVGWRWAFTYLAIGPALGIAAIRRMLAWRAARARGVASVARL